MARARIGISGWTYPGWRGDFYPAGLPRRRELAYAAERLASIEINGSFYALQKPSSYARWRDETPAEFVFAVKGGRYITHVERLRDVTEALANFFASGVLALGPKLGPLLWQLPPTLQFDADLLGAFLQQLPRSTTDAAALGARHGEKVSGDRVYLDVVADVPVRHAIEVRHPSFDTVPARALFERHEVAVVLADTAGRYPVIDSPAEEFAYLRLHGDRELYASGYTAEALDRWASHIRAYVADGRDVYAYFDNDMKGFAPRDARRLDRLVV